MKRVAIESMFSTQYVFPHLTSPRPLNIALQQLRPGWQGDYTLSHNMETGQQTQWP